MSHFIARVVLQKPHDSVQEYRDLDTHMASRGFSRLRDAAEWGPPAKYRLAEERDPCDYIDVRRAAEAAVRETNGEQPFVLDISEE